MSALGRAQVPISECAAREGLQVNVPRGVVP